MSASIRFSLISRFAFSMRPFRSSTLMGVAWSFMDVRAAIDGGTDSPPAPPLPLAPLATPQAVPVIAREDVCTKRRRESMTTSKSMKSGELGGQFAPYPRDRRGWISDILPQIQRRVTALAGCQLEPYVRRAPRAGRFSSDLPRSRRVAAVEISPEEGVTSAYAGGSSAAVSSPLPVRALRWSLILGALVDLSGAIPLLFAPTATARWLGVPVEGTLDFWPTYASVFLFVLPLVYFVSAINPARTLAMIAVAILGRLMGAVVYGYWWSPLGKPTAF